MKLKKINFTDDSYFFIIIEGDDFHNKNLKHNDWAYHWKSKEIVKVKKFNDSTGCWTCSDNVDRDSYKLCRIKYSTYNLNKGGWNSLIPLTYEKLGDLLILNSKDLIIEPADDLMDLLNLIMPKETKNKNKKELIEFNQDYLIVCDNPECDYKIENHDPRNMEKTNDIKKYINMPCPKCSQNLLTVEDYVRANRFHSLIKWINKWFSWINIFIPKSQKNESVSVKIHNGIHIKHNK